MGQPCTKCGSLRIEQRPLFTGMYPHCLACDEPRQKPSANAGAFFRMVSEDQSVPLPKVSRNLYTYYGYCRPGAYQVGDSRKRSLLSTSDSVRAVRDIIKSYNFPADTWILEYSHLDGDDFVTVVAVIVP